MQEHIRLTYLTENLLEMVDKKNTFKHSLRIFFFERRRAYKGGYGGNRKNRSQKDVKKTLSQYFPPEYTAEQMKSVILDLLEKLTKK